MEEERKGYDETGARPGNHDPNSSTSSEPPQPGWSTVVIASPEDVHTVDGQQMGPDRVPLICQSCHARIVTRVERTPTTKTHLIAVLLCLVGCWCCVCAPYYKDCYHNADHYCPNCNVHIGSYVD